MADDKDTTTAKDSAKTERHDHVWGEFVRGDGSAAETVTECTVCGKAKRDA